MTDTNQASEALKQKLSDTKTFNYNVYFGVDGGDYAISFDEALDEIVSIIRTEKLKLLAEVRERVIGESFKPSGFDERYSRQEGDNGHITHYETKKDADTINQHQEYQRTELTKLEAEL